MFLRRWSGSVSVQCLFHFGEIYVFVVPISDLEEPVDGAIQLRGTPFTVGKHKYRPG